jgi:myo-inositol 2-dehydrogenase / D-chiro-inositol 1-dehydrogenase
MMDSECTEVMAFGANNLDKEISTVGGDIDTAITVLKFANGAIGTISNCRANTNGYDQRLEVFGSAGQVSFGNVRPHGVEICDGASDRHTTSLGFFMDRYAQAYTNETLEMIKAIRDNTPPPTNARDGRAAMVIAKAAKLSLDENRIVKTSEIKA